MMRLSRPGLGALTLSVLMSAGCGGPSAKATAQGPDGGGGADSGRGGASGTGTDSGTAGSSAGRDSGVTPVDKTPPDFSGAKAIDVSVGEDRVIVTWDPASDPPNPADKIAYRAYRSSTAGGEDFTRARRCGTPVADASAVAEASLPCYTTTGAGATSVVVRDVLPARDFYYVVRAVDAAGNEDKNTHEVSGQTADETSPEFGGVRSVAAVTAFSIRVAWGAGFDLGTPDSLLTFEVFVSEGVAPDPSKDKPAYTSKPGERSQVITTGSDGKPLKPSTTYKVMVRAVDGAAHTDQNMRVLGVTTPEGIPPTFDGVSRANAEGTAIRLFWPQATDNLTSPPSIVYDVYESLRKGGEDISQPPKVTSAPGASSILIDHLESGTRYYYVVKARDFAGNRDQKPPPPPAKPVEIEVNAQTPVPDTSPPTFNGAQLVTGGSPTSIQITWNIANDDKSLVAKDFTYYIYASTTTPVPLTTPSLTVRGVTSSALTGLAPDTTYNIVILAQDAAGNKSTGVVTQSGKTLAAIAGDTTPPTLGGTPAATLTATNPTQLNITWPAATDLVYAAADIRYHVCASTVQAECTGTKFPEHVLTTTAFGGTASASLPFLSSHTQYFVNVRAEDRSGNVETVEHLTTGTTATSWGTDVRHILFDRCIACHNYDLPSSIVSVQASYTDATNKACAVVPVDGCQLKLVDPGRPQFSYLYRKVNPVDLKTPPFDQAQNLYSGLREPRDTTAPITAGEDEILLSWILQGALGN